jgi:SAM-dependent methyltransferase
VDSGASEEHFHWPDNDVLNEISKRKPGGKMMDIGHSTGAFSERAHLFGWETTGVELSSYVPAPDATPSGAAGPGPEILEGLGLPPQSFDCITLCDALEHLPDPRAVLLEAHRLLKADGLLALQMENEFKSIAATVRRLREKKGAAPVTKPPVHLFYFDQKTIQKFLDVCGFKTIQFRSTGYTNVDSPRSEKIRNMLNKVSEKTGRGATMFVFAQKK